MARHLSLHVQPDRGRSRDRERIYSSIGERKPAPRRRTHPALGGYIAAAAGLIPRWQQLRDAHGIRSEVRGGVVTDVMRGRSVVERPRWEQVINAERAALRMSPR